MNETTPLDGTSGVPWPTSDQRLRVPDTSMLPGSEKAPPAVVKLLKHAVQGAHNSLDRLADSATPAVIKLGESAAAAELALQARAHQLRETRDEWVGSLRGTVRANPLTSVAAAIALGAVIARIVR